MFKQSCPEKQSIPDEITNAELIIALARARGNLSVCSEWHRVLVEAIQTRDEIQEGG